MTKNDPCRTSGIDHIALLVPDLHQTVNFYVEYWGLSVVERDDDRCSLATRSSQHADLILISGSQLAFDHIALSIETQESLQQILSALRSSGYEGIRSVDRSAALPGCKSLPVVLDPDGNTVEFVLGPLASSSNRSASSVDGAPRKIGHVVLGTPRQDAMQAFYRYLGFRATDRTAQGMLFLRCNEDHHTLALTPAEVPWLQHIAYDIDTIDALMRKIASLGLIGMKPIWGPGRHGPGNNVFAYYHDPAGTIIEAYGDLETFPEFDPDIAVREWGSEHRGDTWGLAGPPPQTFFRPGPRPVARSRRDASVKEGTT